MAVLAAATVLVRAIVDGAAAVRAALVDELGDFLDIHCEVLVVDVGGSFEDALIKDISKDDIAKLGKVSR